MVTYETITCGVEKLFHVKVRHFFTKSFVFLVQLDDTLSFVTKTHKQYIGHIGEDAVVKSLQKRGFSILERNYLKKWGELDIVAWKIDKIHFVEVKSLSREITLPSDPKGNRDHGRENYRPEENVHSRKRQRLSRTIQTYLSENKVPENIEWQFDVVTVLVDEKKRLCRVTLLNDITL